MTTIHIPTPSAHVAETPDQPTLPGFSPVWLELPTLIEGHFNRLVGTGFVDGLVEASLQAIWHIIFGDENEIIVVPNPNNAAQPFHQPADNVVTVLQLEHFVELLIGEMVGVVTEAPKFDWRDVKVSRDTRADLHIFLESIFGSERAADVLMAPAVEAIQRTYTGDVYVDVALPDGVHHAGLPAIPAWKIFEDWDLGYVWAQVLEDNE